MTYVFTFRRLWWPFKRRYVVIGHYYSHDQDKMQLYLPGGYIREIAKWSKCELYLGADWVLFQKTQLEKQAGQSIPLNV